MNTSIRKIALATSLVLLAGTALSAQDWRGRGRAHGQVVDEQGKPVAGAKVTLHVPEQPENGPEPLITKEDGRWAFGGVEGGTWTVVVEKEGYMISEGSFAVNEFQPGKSLQVELKKSAYSSIDVGQAFLDEGKFDEARAAFQEALPSLDEQYRPQLEALIADTYYQQGSYAEARSRYEAVLAKLAPADQVHVLLRLGDSYLQEQQFAQARQRFEQALPHVGAEGLSPLYLAIARTYDQEGDRAQAIAAVEKALETTPDDVQAIQLIADLLSREGRDEEAEAYLQKLPEDTKLPPDMLLNVGIRLYNEQKYDQALENFNRVVAQNPDLPEAYYYRGLVYLGREANDQARADFEKLIELAPDSQQAAEAREFLTYLEPGSR